MKRGRSRSTIFTTALLSAATLALASVGTGTAARGKVIGQGVRLKGTSIWYAHGQAVEPKTISASVVPIPAQPVKVQWAVVCQKRNAYDPAMHLATGAKSGTASVDATATVKLAFPYAKPHTCIASVYATLSGSGKLTLRVLQT